MLSLLSLSLLFASTVEEISSSPTLEEEAFVLQEEEDLWNQLQKEIPSSEMVLFDDLDTEDCFLEEVE